MIRDYIKMFLIKSKKASTNQLYTKWGEELKKKPLTEYPRPQLKRDSYIPLNGLWNYAVTKTREFPGRYDGRILVPFSPESALSGVGRQIMPRDYLWYERKITVKEIRANSRLILHFGAVDQYAKVFVNKKKAVSHLGGYLPFSADITDMLVKGKNELLVMVRDASDTSYHSRGKQKLLSGGMFYTAQSGIWQSVWMEWVPDYYIKNLKITPLYEESMLQLEITMNNQKEGPEIPVWIQVTDKERLILSQEDSGNKLLIPLPGFIPWSPENPHLYGLTVIVGEDRVDSYFAMRKVEVKKDEKGIPRIFLNGKPYFQNGVLDQGYWPDGLYTPPSDEAMIYDILTMKKLGFNMLRKHIKVEPLRWYYHCDRLGMLVWQDMVNGGDSYNMLLLGYLPNFFPRVAEKIKDNWYPFFSRRNEKGRQEWKADLAGTIEHLYNSPCIVVWVPFNEGWGQFDSEEAVRLIKGIDNFRLIDQASGWFDQKGGDFKSIHNYFRKLHIVTEKRAVVLSEFAGFACPTTGHMFSKNIYGYKIYRAREDFEKAVGKLYKEELPMLIKKGLSAAVFTQLSDVEDEINGLLTYDRKVLKVTKIPKL
ncbi:glycoside hydrolase family 2 protein [Anaerocolumna xylanovorans]|uniref:Glycosyl hydrolases family 2, TIM barrel domain n=1 Tax=Anaerocolumna xylanovorans DSM 12503 TaxID=1121345 RepID=A0A1M7YGI9_9FIRM|nr:sugar-binding domain-containing protein [Anaerocolumna xylanovorans]SHO51730.1 Glycosyl hydrolases family 2, TIM barrel domain [Anaerocolumna xylanovorans DSM 12503]